MFDRKLKFEIFSLKSKFQAQFEIFSLKPKFQAQFEIPGKIQKF